MSRRRRYERPKQKTSFALNITSMTDMFTIMLVFLLQTYSTANVEIIPEKGLELPASTSALNPVEGVKLSLSMDALKIGDRQIASVTDRHIAGKEVDANDPQFIPSLYTELDALIKQSDKPEIKEGRILLQADTRLPYETLKKVMYTASMAGFAQMKLITLVGN